MLPHECDLFGYQGADSHLGYKNLFVMSGKSDEDNPHITYLRQSVSCMWKKFKPLAGPNFMSDFPRQPDQRYWEMYLGSYLLDQGLEVTSKSEGPDFRITRGDKIIWVEAVTASLGQEGTPDRVPEIIPLSEGGGVQAVPRDKMIIRYRQSLDVKEKKYREYVNDGTVSTDDIKVIAVSRGELRRAGSDGDRLPYIVSAVFPAGQEFITFDRETGNVVGGGRHFQPTIAKANGKPVETLFFTDPDHADISAVIYSSSDIGNIPRQHGADLIVIHNPLANNPLPQGALNIPMEYWAEQDETSWLIKHTKIPIDCHD